MTIKLKNKENNTMINKVKSLISNFKKNKNFSSQKYWEERYQNNGNSGKGSYDQLAVFKAEVINNFIKEKNIKDVIEFGSGDGNQLALFEIENYLGLDVSEKSIEICEELYKEDENKKFQLYKGSSNNKDFKNATLTMSLDVIYHLVEDEVYESYLNDLFNNSKNYVIIYASNTNKQKQFQAQHVKHRKFTDYVEKNFSNWKLIKHIKNKYPKLSFADFYIFEKDSSK